MAVKFHSTRNGKAPYSTSKLGWQIGSETCLWTFLHFAFSLKKPDQIGDRISGSQQQIFPPTLRVNIPSCALFFSFMNCSPNPISEAPPRRDPAQTTLSQPLSRSEATVNNRRSTTRPPANQSGAVQQSDQWLAGFSLGGGAKGRSRVCEINLFVSDVQCWFLPAPVSQRDFFFFFKCLQILA